MAEIIPKKTRFSSGTINFYVMEETPGKPDTYTVLQSITGILTKPKATEMSTARIVELMEEDEVRKVIGEMHTRSKTSKGGAARLTRAESQRAKNRRDHAPIVRRHDYRSLLAKVHAQVQARMQTAAA